MAAQDVTIKDIHVKKGTAVTTSAWVIQRDPEVWENPEDFDPDRQEELLTCNKPKWLRQYLLFVVNRIASTEL